MSLLPTITADLKEAMKERNQSKLNVLRSLKSALSNTAIEQKISLSDLPQSDCLSVIRKQIKQRQDSAEQYHSHQRQDLADNELKEIQYLENYLPTALTDQELQELISQAIAQTGAKSRADMGAVMGILKQTSEGRADGKTLSQAVLAALS